MKETIFSPQILTTKESLSIQLDKQTKAKEELVQNISSITNEITESERQAAYSLREIQANKGYAFVNNGAIPFCFLAYLSLALLSLYINIPILSTTISNVLYNFSIKALFVLLLWFVVFFVIWKILRIHKLFFRKSFLIGSQKHQELESLQESIKVNREKATKFEQNIEEVDETIELLEYKIRIIDDILQNGYDCQTLTDYINIDLEVELCILDDSHYYAHAEELVQFLYDIGYKDAAKYDAIILWVKYYDWQYPGNSEELQRKALSLGYPAPIADKYRHHYVSSGINLDYTNVNTTSNTTGSGAYGFPEELGPNYLPESLKGPY